MMDRFGEIVKVKEFPFDTFPHYVKTLSEYRWKPLIVALELQIHPVIFWMDSSTVHKQNLQQLLDHFQHCTDVDQCQYYPWILFDYTGHSIFATTNEKVCES